MSDHPSFSVEVIRDIEAELAEPLFRGVPIGSTLNDLCVIDFYLGHGDWGFVSGWKNRLRRLKHFARPKLGREAMPDMPHGRILVTWISDNFRISGLVHPVLKELESEEPLVLCGASDMRCKALDPASAISWEQVMHYDVAAWRSDYRRCRGPWQERLRKLCRKHRLPRGAYDCLALHLLVSSQYAAGCLEFLQALRPSAILTEYDRNAKWSLLVLSARVLAIPTCTMVHGVLNERALGFVPVLADKVFCWGELQRRQFLAEGEDPAKILVTGCPRITRDLAATQAGARRKLGLAVEKPVVMLGTTMVDDRERRNIAELFCAAVETIKGISGMVRLHPSDRLDTYARAAIRYPDVRFTQYGDATLDEAMAAADLVVVPNSGLGSDALVKGRLTIVLDLPTQRIGHGSELIEKAGCPRAASADELATLIDCLLFDAKERERHFAIANEYVGDFCAAFGRDAARRIGDLVRKECLIHGITTTNKRESP